MSEQEKFTKEQLIVMGRRSGKSHTTAHVAGIVDKDTCPICSMEKFMEEL